MEMRNKTILMVFEIILLLGIASAIYPGESVILKNELKTENLTWIIIENSSELIVLPTVSINSSHIMLYLPTNMPPNSFTLVFSGEVSEEEKNTSNFQIIQLTSNTRGGGGSSGICRTEWTCTEWSECDNLIQTRFCSYPPRFCKPNQPKPAEIQNCIPEKEIIKKGGGEILILTTQPANSFATITSAVIGALGTNGTIGVFIFIFCIIGTAIFLIFKKRRN